MVDELGFDAGINYKTEDIAEALKNAAPNGVDRCVHAELACHSSHCITLCLKKRF